MQLNSEVLQFCIGDQQIIDRMSDLPADPPFTDERIDFLNEVSKKLLSDQETKEYSDVATFAFWIRKANMDKEKKDFYSDNKLRIGRGVVFHIAPSNVAVNYAYSFAVGFILGNANIVRLPSRIFPQVNIINQAIQAVVQQKNYKKWKAYLTFLRYEKNKEITDYFSSICDLRVIWGGDHAIREIRKSEIAPRASEITFADRYSICVLDAEDYLMTEKKDTYLLDQNACTSPRLVCWIGEHEKIQKAKEIFWAELWKVIEERYTFQPIQYVDKLTNSCLAAVAIEGVHVTKMKDNRIVRIELEKINPLILKYRGESGIFYEYELKDIMELAPICNTKMQTVSILGNSERLISLIQSGVKGIDRVLQIGKTMDFGFIWDGYDLRERLTRKIIMF